ncbi:hypothetical protein PIIN_11176 [Serendipita indica DSM 11827]|uniref:Uncharacterized protein n=1 Tax=Serendipita indica (strain DSM 11827) TaxID=1109443 RepID=G4U0V1_SERID|nr:hypothetical protein PIIN_11176 [Serendipita indica DSM 11827]
MIDESNWRLDVERANTRRAAAPKRTETSAIVLETARASAQIHPPYTVDGFDEYQLDEMTDSEQVPFEHWNRALIGGVFYSELPMRAAAIATANERSERNARRTWESSGLYNGTRERRGLLMDAHQRHSFNTTFAPTGTSAEPEIPTIVSKPTELKTC